MIPRPRHRRELRRARTDRRSRSRRCRASRCPLRSRLRRRDRRGARRPFVPARRRRARHRRAPRGAPRLVAARVAASRRARGRSPRARPLVAIARSLAPRPLRLARTLVATRDGARSESLLRPASRSVARVVGELDRRRRDVERRRTPRRAIRPRRDSASRSPRDEQLLERRARELEPARAQIVHRRHGLDRDLPLGDLLDVAQQPMLARLGERDRDAFAAGATRAADAMHVRVGRRRHVEVHDVRHVLDVETARRDVRRDEQLRRAVAEAAHDAIALLLRQPAVQRFGAIAAAAERLGELVDFGARATEDDRRRRRFHVEHARERRDLVPALHDERDLAHARRLARRDAARARS